MDMTDKFKAVCEKHDIDPDTFPFDFCDGSLVDYSKVADAMLWMVEQKLKRPCAQY